MLLLQEKQLRKFFFSVGGMLLIDNLKNSGDKGICHKVKRIFWFRIVEVLLVHMCMNYENFQNFKQNRMYHKKNKY